VEVAPGKKHEAFKTFDLEVPVEDGSDVTQLIPHICSASGEDYIIRVRNNSGRHVACSVTVDGENTLLRDGSLIVAPGDSRELPGYLVAKNFVGKEYVKEYRSFCFGRPKVVEASAPTAEIPEERSYTTYGRILCEVYEAVLDEEVDSDTELRGQTTYYRGAGLHGSFDERVVPEGKKKHFMYSSVTVQGGRAAISNSTRGRWWVRGERKLRTLELRYREPHSLMLMGVDPKELGIVTCKQEGDVKEEAKEEEEDKLDSKVDTEIQCCDLTGDEHASWTMAPVVRATPVDVE